MLPSILIILTGTIIYLVSAFLSLITTIMPTEFETSLISLFSNLKYANGFFPVDTLILCLSTLFTFMGLIYVVKGVLWAINFIPGVHEAHKLPEIKGTTKNKK